MTGSKSASQVQLCLRPTPSGPCRRLAAHTGGHAAQPTLWNGIGYDPGEKTRKKIVKAGFATPRGGAKGGYQNHVTRSSRVILPYEHTDKVDFSNYEQGYVVRLTAAQARALLSEHRVTSQDERLYVEIGGELHQAFVLYRSSTDEAVLRPRQYWKPCEHRINGVVSPRRSEAGEDYGHFLLRIPRATPLGIQQGIFAPEYVGKSENYACQLFLTYLAYMTEGYPRDPNLDHVIAVLQDLGVFDPARWSLRGITDTSGVTSCPLCNRRIAAPELHETIDPSRIPGLANSGVQLDETRSTLVNLYHLRPLLYSPTLGHTVQNIAWGHAHCNTLLSQRASYTATELAVQGDEPDIALYWSDDQQFIRSADGRAWVSVTPVPPGTESFTEFLADQGLGELVGEASDEDDEG